jgi:hypothetical protein
VYYLALPINATPMISLAVCIPIESDGLDLGGDKTEPIKLKSIGYNSGY